MKKNIQDAVADFFLKDRTLREVNSFWHFFLHPKNRDAKEQALFTIWNQIEDHRPGMEKDADRALTKLKHNLTNNKHTRYALSFRIIWKYAAFLLLPVLLFATAWEYAIRTKQVETVVLSTSNAMTKSVTLPDGTTVMLNAGSSLTYPKTFLGDDREVTLSGEANFSIFPDKEKPFVVKVSNLRIKALGTKFNVNAYAASKIVTTLEEGSIQIANDRESIIVKPNEQVTYLPGNHGFEATPIDVSVATAWMKGDLIFEETSLSEIFAGIERYHDLTIKVEGVLDDKIKYSVKYNKSETLVQKLEVLCHMTGYISYFFEDEKHVVIVNKKR